MPTSAPDPAAPPFRWWLLAWKLALPPARLLARAGWRLRVRYEAALPAGPIVLAANHLSHLDPPIVGIAVGKPLRFLAVDGLWGVHLWLDAVLRAFGSIPLSRIRVPLAAIRTAVDHLRSGGSVGIFPEGGIVDAWGASDSAPSAAWLSLRGDVPLVPVAVTGTDEAFGLGAGRLRRSHVIVTIGPALNPGDYRDLDNPASTMMAAWAAWMNDHMDQGPHL